MSTIVRNTLMLAALALGACSTAPVYPPPPPPAPGAPAAAPGAPAPAPAPAPPAKPQTAPTTNKNPPANVNLQGFPLPYRQGYTDGCASVGSTEQKDAARFKNDGQYRTGWQDGFFLCKKK